MARASILFGESVAMAHEAGDRFELARGFEGLAGALSKTAPKYRRNAGGGGDRFAGCTRRRGAFAGTQTTRRLP